MKGKDERMRGEGGRVKTLLGLLSFDQGGALLSKVRGATAGDLISINCEEVIKGLEQTNIQTKKMTFISTVTHSNHDKVDSNFTI